MEEERAIEVRGLDGSSTVVRISPEATVGDLKAVLKESFPPAKESLNFRLFYKGAQLRAGSSIASHLIDQGEFLVLVPFSKRTRECQPPESPSGGSAKTTKWCSQVETSADADLAWLDMMEDLRSLSDPPDASPIHNVVIEGNISHGKHNVEGGSSPATKSNREESCFLFLRNILHNSRNVLDSLPSGQSSSSPVSGFADCLSDPDSRKCFFSEEFYRRSGEADLCMCPVWMKRLVKCFSFLNAAHSILLMQHRCIEWKCLRQALEQPGAPQMEDINISDVEHLLNFCPEVVMLGNHKTFLSKSRDAVVILDYADELSVHSMHKGRVRSSHASTIFAREKRENAFKDVLLTMIRSAPGRITSGSMMPSSLSLEDLIDLKERRDFSEGSRLRVAKNDSLSSESHAECLCRGTTALQPLEMVEHLQKGLGIHGQIVHVEEFPAKAAVYAELPSDLSENITAALKRIGISRLYSHQADAIRSSLSGKNIVIATSTSSGKSLCYNIPVFEELSRNTSSCALYLFPTKALAQDQLRALLEMARGLGENLDIGVYDGDTPQNDRAFIRNNARLLITNPDMLHVSVLPFHGQFKRILSNLRFIVIDEAHAYKGAFGCHTSLILRRLRRICFHVYGRDPSFIFCTATSANPQEHALELANLQDLELISNDGSPCGPKLFLLWNPPLYNQQESLIRGSKKKKFVQKEATGRRSSPIYEVSCLLAEMVQHGLRCIAFCKSRKLCELILCYARKILGEVSSDLVDLVSVYRAGYTAKDRRNIEKNLFGGKLRGIAATNALELGIDVGHIDATLHLGFPGSVASFWQQAGRSGRRLQSSLSIYVAFEGPLDQYFMKFPKKLFGNPIENCQVDAYNSQALEQHITCAAFEHPLCMQFDEKYFGNGLRNVVVALKSRGYLSFNSSCNIWSYIGPEKQPSLTISIRAIETEKYTVVDMLSNETLEEIEESKAFFQVYDGAVYINQGITYLVKALDLSRKMAFCQKTDLKYYTKTRDYTDVHVYGGDHAYPPEAPGTQSARATARYHPCRVTTKWFGFHCIWRGSNRIFDTVNLSLPPYSYESKAVWIRVPRSIRASVEARSLSFRAGKHAASHALLNLAPLYIMCNASDLGTECANPHENRDIPDRLLLYDQHPGGMGFSMRLQPLFRELLSDALRLLRSCRCSVGAGCPDCVQSLSCREYNEVLDKEAAMAILEGLAEPERDGVLSGETDPTVPL